MTDFQAWRPRARGAQRCWSAPAGVLAGCASDEDALRKQVADLRYDVPQATSTTPTSSAACGWPRRATAC